MVLPLSRATFLASFFHVFGGLPHEVKLDLDIRVERAAGVAAADEVHSFFQPDLM
jgi:hypothetical protein